MAAREKFLAEVKAHTEHHRVMIVIASALCRPCVMFVCAGFAGSQEVQREDDKITTLGIRYDTAGRNDWANLSKLGGWSSAFRMYHLYL